MTVVARWLKKAFKDGSNLEARRAMIFAAFTGGLCLNAGVVLGHSVAYTISNQAHIPHGVSCAMALPYTIAYNQAALADRLDVAAGHVLGKADAGGDALALWVGELVNELGIPLSLQGVGIQETDLATMAEECLNKYPRPTNPAPITMDRLKLLYEKMYHGDVKGSIDAFRSI
jgi:alcohol dehydrogenase class IV